MTVVFFINDQNTYDTILNVGYTVTKLYAIEYIAGISQNLSHISRSLAKLWLFPTFKIQDGGRPPLWNYNDVT